MWLTVRVLPRLVVVFDEPGKPHLPNVPDQLACWSFPIEPGADFSHSDYVAGVKYTLSGRLICLGKFCAYFSALALCEDGKGFHAGAETDVNPWGETRPCFVRPDFEHGVSFGTTPSHEVAITCSPNSPDESNWMTYYLRQNCPSSASAPAGRSGSLDTLTDLIDLAF
jgi:hypothetical protein